MEPAGKRELVANTSRRRVLGAGVAVGLAAIGNTAVAIADDGVKKVPLELSRVDAELSPSVRKLNVVTSDLSEDDFNYLEAVPTENVVATEANVAFAHPSLSMAMNTLGTMPAVSHPRSPRLPLGSLPAGMDDAVPMNLAGVDMPGPRAPERGKLAHHRVTPVPPRLVCAAQATPPRHTRHTHLRGSAWL